MDQNAWNLLLDQLNRHFDEDRCYQTKNELLLKEINEKIDKLMELRGRLYGAVSMISALISLLGFLISKVF